MRAVVFLEPQYPMYIYHAKTYIIWKIKILLAVRRGSVIIWQIQESYICMMRFCGPILSNPAHVQAVNSLKSDTCNMFILNF